MVKWSTDLNMKVLYEIIHCGQKNQALWKINYKVTNLGHKYT